MKKLFYIISIIAGLYSCDQNPIEEISPEQIASESDEKIPVTFQMTFPDLIDYETDLVPMSRADIDTVKSRINNEYKAIIMKKINEQWFVDTVIKGQRFKVSNESTLNITENSTFSPIQIDLRPGVYKMTLFLGVNNTDFNKELKKGFLVSSTPDMVPGQNLPVAVYPHIAGPKNYWSNEPPEGTYWITREIFAGTVSFTVSKDPDLTTKGVNTPLNIALKRKVSRYRFLLKRTEKYPVDATAYTINFVLKATDTDNPFCNGLDVLGGSYYDTSNPLREIILYESTTYFHLSPEDNQLYHMAETAGGGSTNFGPFIILDKPINFELTLPLITGKADTYPAQKYKCEDIIQLTLQPNSLLTNVFFQSDKTSIDPDTDLYTFKYLNAPNANQLFDPYYEWNAYHQIKSNQ